MKAKILGSIMVALFGALVGLNAVAQAPAGAPAAPGGPGGGGRGGAPVAVKPGIDLPTAKKMMAAAESAAVEAKVNVAIAIVDANGDLVYFVRMDGATGRAVTSSQGKARAALLFGMPSKDVADAVAADKPVSVTLTNPLPGAEITLQQGGIPIFKNGKIIAAIGAGGSMPSIDEKIAQAGADAVK
jgi:glc operon protein GlcG